MAHMIVLIFPDRKTWYVQIGNMDQLETFNLHFSDSGEWVNLDGFSIPCLGSEPVWDIYGDRYSRTIAHLNKTLPKCKDPSQDIPQFLTQLSKKFKIDAYQINVNSNFDWSNLTAWDASSAVVSICKDLLRAGFALKFW